MKQQICDMCGDPFTGKPMKVYDENYNLQRGIISCGCHIPVGDADGEELTIKENTI